MVLFCNAVEEEEETNNLLKRFLFTIEIYACFCLLQLVQASPEVKERTGQERWSGGFVIFCSVVLLRTKKKKDIVFVFFVLVFISFSFFEFFLCWNWTSSSMASWRAHNFSRSSRARFCCFFFVLFWFSVPGLFISICLRDCSRFPIVFIRLGIEEWAVVKRWRFVCFLFLLWSSWMLEPLMSWLQKAFFCFVFWFDLL